LITQFYEKKSFFTHTQFYEAIVAVGVAAVNPKSNFIATEKQTNNTQFYDKKIPLTHNFMRPSLLLLVLLLIQNRTSSQQKSKQTTHNFMTRKFPSHTIL
jgi:hypothetical protein